MQSLEVRNENYAGMNSKDKVKPEIIWLNRELTLLKIKANPLDLVLFQTFFCADCQNFVAIGNLFPLASTLHRGHYLAWLPNVDEPAPGKQANLIAKWLESADFTPARRQWLAQIPTSNAMNWAWVCNNDEYQHWSNFLDGYLENLLENWLAALNGEDNNIYGSDSIWEPKQPSHLKFKWSDDSLV